MSPAPVVQDTPDNQRGVVQPQVLLEVFLHPAGGGVVNLPPNCESLLLIGGGVFITSVIGTTSGRSYPIIQSSEALGAGGGFAICMVSPAADPAVTISFATTSTNLYVVADAGVRVVADMILQAMTIAALGGGIAPSAALMVGGIDVNGDGWPLQVEAGVLEVIQVGANVHAHGSTANGVPFLGAPATGKANRISKVVVSVAGVPECVNLTGATSGVIYGAVDLGTANYTGEINFPSPIDVTEALVLSDTSINQNIAYSIHYRVVNAV